MFGIYNILLYAFVLCENNKKAFDAPTGCLLNITVII